MDHKNKIVKDTTMKLTIFEKAYSKLSFFAIVLIETQLFYCSLLFIIYCLISQYDSITWLVNMWMVVEK
jgi:hypothetical protein